MSQRLPWSALVVLSWANVAHLVALAFAAVGMRPGTPLVPLPQRLTYLAGAPLGWTLGWICWMLCAVLLIAFLAVVNSRLQTGNNLGQLGLMIAVAGAACDLFCDTVYLVVFPWLASWQPPPEGPFLIVERLTGIASLVIANGAYSVAVLLISAALRGQEAIGPFSAWLGYAVGLAGLVLAVAGFTGVPEHAQWATPPTIGLFCVWVVVVARSLEAGGRVR